MAAAVMAAVVDAAAQQAMGARAVMGQVLATELMAAEGGEHLPSIFMPTTSSKKVFQRSFAALALISLVVLLIFGVVSVRSKMTALVPSTAQSTSTRRDTRSSLVDQNAAYAQADAALAQRDYAGAATQYNAALAQVSTASNQTTIRFMLAYSQAAAGQYADAVSTYKQIAAASSTVSAKLRATAVQNMAHLYDRYGAPVITDEIFKDEPYHALFKDGHIGRSYRNLYDYAASIYPLAYAELASANWYVNQILNDATTQRAEYVNIVHSKLSAADQDIAAMRADPESGYALLYALEERAVVLGKLRRVGDASAADPEVAFKDLLTLYGTLQLHADGTSRLQYVYFLALSYGSKRAADITSILAPVIASPDSHGQGLKTFLGNAKNDQGATKSNLVLLASIDPAFKTFLQSLGWTDADFK